MTFRILCNRTLNGATEGLCFIYTGGDIQRKMSMQIIPNDLLTHRATINTCPSVIRRSILKRMGRVFFLYVFLLFLFFLLLLFSLIPSAHANTKNSKSYHRFHTCRSNGTFPHSPFHFSPLPTWSGWQSPYFDHFAHLSMSLGRIWKTLPNIRSSVEITYSTPLTPGTPSASSLICVRCVYVVFFSFARE